MQRAVVLLSGGLDSATTLAMAINAGYVCYALSIDYGQRQRAELDAATRIAIMLQVVEHRIIHLDLGAMGGSALTDPDVAVPTVPSVGIPVTYVPARNTVLLALALGWAEVLKIKHIFVGVNAVDYSGYPDCRPDFIRAFENLANVATKAGVEGTRFEIHAPLLHLSKGEIIHHGVSLGLDYSLTVSCYQADPQGRACGCCDACRLRRQGFIDARIVDPTCYVE
ncbi:7-cyano-7-deazaguanine synthase [Achromatium sp. WMS2]|nr:7-cyano-7-deazaguanine synthase [Achromatium sp. WMS2]